MYCIFLFTVNVAVLPCCFIENYLVRDICSIYEILPMKLLLLAEILEDVNKKFVSYNFCFSYLYLSSCLRSTC